MKPVFKCEYCSFMGTEDEVKEHEPTCMDNYDRRSCYTCTHKKLTTKDGKWCYECKADIEIPVEKIFEFCPSYDRKESSNYDLGDIFGSLFK